MMPILAILTALATASPAPLEAITPTIDLGAIRSGPPRNVRFELVNRSTDAIEIIRVEPGCGCIRPSVSRMQLAPNERADLTISINTLTSPPGPQSWSVTVVYRVGKTDPATLALRAQGEIIPELTITPAQLAFSTATVGNQTITVSDRSGKPRSIVGVRTTHAGLVANLDEATTTEKGWTRPIRLRLLETYPVGQAEEYVIFSLNDSECPEVRLPVRITKRASAAIVVTPAEARIRLDTTAAEGSMLIQLRRVGAGTIRITDAESSSVEVKTRFSTGAAPIATVRILVKPNDLASRSGSATVRIRLAEPDGEVVTLPVEWSRP